MHRGYGNQISIIVAQEPHDFVGCKTFGALIQLRGTGATRLRRLLEVVGKTGDGGVDVWHRSHTTSSFASEYAAENVFWVPMVAQEPHDFVVCKPQQNRSH